MITDGTSRRSRISRTALVALQVFLLLFAAVYLLGFWWEYSHILPQVGAASSHTRWYNGLLHGVYAPLNFIVELFFGDSQDTVFQGGGGRAYQFWFLLGIGAFAGGGSSVGSRR